MPYDPGQVVVVRFPFTNHEKTKQRPAVIVSSTKYNRSRADVILIAVTSQIRQPLRLGEAYVDDWQQAGLLKPSLFKPVLFTAEQNILRKSPGQLSERDGQALQRLLGTILQYKN